MFFGQPVSIGALADDECTRVDRILADLTAAAREHGMNAVTDNLVDLNPYEQLMLLTAAVHALAIDDSDIQLGDSRAWQIAVTARTTP